MLLSRRFGYVEISNWLKSEGQQLICVKAPQFLSFLKFHIFYYFLSADSFMKFYMHACTNEHLAKIGLTYTKRVL